MRDLAITLIGLAGAFCFGWQTRGHFIRRMPPGHMQSVVSLRAMQVPSPEAIEHAAQFVAMHQQELLDGEIQSPVIIDGVLFEVVHADVLEKK